MHESDEIRNLRLSVEALQDANLVNLKERAIASSEMMLIALETTVDTIDVVLDRIGRLETQIMEGEHG
tara:strand:+ start:5376 stop:5579 length:204 start_codon:yes stop_codon:yes gene_type:complete